MQKLTTKIVFVFGALALAVIIAATTALAGRDGHRHEHFAERIAEELSLTDAQESRLETLLRETAEERRRLRDQTGAEIREILSQETMTREDARKILRLRKDRREEMQDFIAGQIVAFHSELDAMQREKLAALAPRFVGRYGKRGHGYHRDDDDHHRGGWFGNRGDRKHGYHHDDDDHHHGWFGNRRNRDNDDY